jgi:hypothetical protein
MATQSILDFSSQPNYLPIGEDNEQFDRGMERKVNKTWLIQSYGT